MPTSFAVNKGGDGFSIGVTVEDAAISAAISGTLSSYNTLLDSILKLWYDGSKLKLSGIIFLVFNVTEAPSYGNPPIDRVPV